MVRCAFSVQLTIIFKPKIKSKLLIIKFLLKISALEKEMTYYNILIVLTCLLLGLAHGVQAQPGFMLTGPSVTPTIDDTFEVRFRAVDFDDVKAVQFSLSWDVEKAEFLTIESGYPTDQVDFNTNNSDQGVVVALWAEIITYSMPDTATLLTMTFKALSEGPLNFEFINQPTSSLVAYEINGQTFEEELNLLTDGDISVGMEMSLLSTNDDNLIFSAANPNPFTDFTYIPISLDKAETVLVTILGVDGKQIYQYSNRFGGGNHQIKINSEVLPGPGSYWCRLETTATSTTKKLILVK